MITVVLAVWIGRFVTAMAPSLVWVDGPNGYLVVAEVVDAHAGGLRTLAEGIDINVSSIDALRPVPPFVLDGIADMTQLPDLHIGALLQNLRARYVKVCKRRVFVPATLVRAACIPSVCTAWSDDVLFVSKNGERYFFVTLTFFFPYVSTMDLPSCWPALCFCCASGHF